MDPPGEGLLIRRARTSDRATLERFQQGIITAERPFDPQLRETGAQYYDIARMLENPDVHLLVAEHEGSPIACAFARIDTAKPWLRQAREAYLGLMYVEPSWRGRGVNARLLARLEDWCREQGINELRLDVYAANEPAVAAYRKAGFRTTLLEMRLTLDPAGANVDRELRQECE